MMLLTSVTDIGEGVGGQVLRKMLQYGNGRDRVETNYITDCKPVMARKSERKARKEVRYACKNVVRKHEC
jgi:hypothetical protein